MKKAYFKPELRELGKVQEITGGQNEAQCNEIFWKKKSDRPGEWIPCSFTFYP